MYKMETRIRQIKEMTLVEMAKLLKEGKLEECLAKLPKVLLPGPDSNYRGSLYLEREILAQRIKIYLGLDMDKVRTMELYEIADILESIFENKMPEIMAGENIIQVVKEACDACPSGHYVSDLCRGCLEKPCFKSCPKQAISFNGRRAHIDSKKCINCGLCRKACKFFAIQNLVKPCRASCPVGAIDDDEYGRTVINRERCVTCGRCTIACPFGAIEASAQLLEVLQKMKEGKEVIAICAPSIVAQFGVGVLFRNIKQALKDVGFTKVMDAYFDVLEVAYGADLVAEEEALHLDEHHEFMTTSCCPAFVEYIKKHKKEFIEHISPVASPMGKMGKVVREKNPSATIVFIGPCYAKKLEGHRDPSIDYVLTYEGLQFIFEAAWVDPKDYEAVGEVEGTKEGWNFACSGGVSGYVQKLCKRPIKAIVMDGLEEANMAFSKVIEEECDLLEGMACKGGCVGGPGTLANPKVAAKFIKDLKVKSIEDK